MRKALVFTLLLIANVWPAFYNHQPFFYADTTTDLRGADAAVERFLHRSTVWSKDNSTAQKSLSSVHDKAVLSGRSVYYGVLLYLGHIVGQLWPVVFLQSAVVLIAIALTLHSLRRFTWLRFSFISLSLAALSPMPFFVSFLMPDIFAAVAILAVAALLLSTDGAPRWMIFLWTALLATALLFHISNTLIAIVLLALVVPAAALLMRVSVPRRGVIAIAFALLVAFAGEFVFDAAVKKVVGELPLRPPFFMARVIADGPGYRYLLVTCPASGFTVCRFLDRLPAEADEFVWGTDPDRGVFAVTDAATRRALSNEQYRFAMAVFRFDASGEVAAFLRDAGGQIMRIGYQEFDYDPNGRDFLRKRLPLSYYSVMKNSPAWNDTVPKLFFSLIAILTTCLALASIAYWLFSRRSHLIRARQVLHFASLVCLGIVVNGVICTVPASHDRYQMRVIWLIPLAAILLYLKPNRRLSPRSTT